MQLSWNNRQTQARNLFGQPRPRTLFGQPKTRKLFGQRRARYLFGQRRPSYLYGTDRAQQLQSFPTEGVRLVPSDVFLWAAGGSVLLSLGLRLMGRRNDSLFVGEWVPTMVSLGVLARLVGR